MIQRNFISNTSRKQNLLLFITQLLLLKANFCYIKGIKLPGDVIPACVQFSQGKEQYQDVDGDFRALVHHENELFYRKVVRYVNMTGSVIKVTIVAELVNMKGDNINSFSIIFPADESAQMGNILLEEFDNATSSFNRVQPYRFKKNIIPNVEDYHNINSSSNYYNQNSEDFYYHYLPSNEHQSSAFLYPYVQCSYDAIEMCHASIYTVSLVSSLAKNSSFKFRLTVHLGHAWYPFPDSIRISENQMALHYSHSIWSSPYLCMEQKTTYRMPRGFSSSKLSILEGLRKLSDTEYETKLMKNVEPYNVGNLLRFHSIVRHHLGYFPCVSRTIEVSHWGNIFFHEEYLLINEAAKLKGEFSRIDFSKLVTESKNYQDLSVLMYLSAILPKHSYNIEYYDKIGNISTSHAYKRSKGSQSQQISLDIMPRFPLFGGWKTDFQIEYNLPVEYAIKRLVQTNTYVLNITFGQPFLSIYTNHLVNTIILPPGAHNIRIVTPEQVFKYNQQVAWRWLDIISGRPAVVLETYGYFSPSTDLVSQKMLIIYDYTSFLYDLHKLLSLCVLCFIFFVIYISYKRCHLRICSDDEAKIEDFLYMRNSVMNHLLELFEDLTHFNGKLERAANDFALKPLAHRFRAARDNWESNVSTILKRLHHCLSPLPENDTLHEVCVHVSNLLLLVQKFPSIKVAQDEEISKDCSGIPTINMVQALIESLDKKTTELAKEILSHFIQPKQKTF